MFAKSAIVLFGVAAILPLLAAAAGAWLLPPGWLPLVLGLGVLWAGCILVFLGGVHRGAESSECLKRKEVKLLTEDGRSNGYLR